MTLAAAQAHPQLRMLASHNRCRYAYILQHTRQLTISLRLQMGSRSATFAAIQSVVWSATLGLEPLKRMSATSITIASMDQGQAGKASHHHNKLHACARGAFFLQMGAMAITPHMGNMVWGCLGASFEAFVHFPFYPNQLYGGGACSSVVC